MVGQSHLLRPIYSSSKTYRLGYAKFTEFAASGLLHGIIPTGQEVIVRTLNRQKHCLTSLLHKLKLRINDIKGIKH